MKKPKQLKRSSYVSASALPLGKRPLKIWGYDQEEKFVCRLEISSAGLAVFSGDKGGKRLCDLSWEELVKNLSKK